MNDYEGISGIILLALIFWALYTIDDLQKENARKEEMLKKFEAEKNEREENEREEKDLELANPNEVQAEKSIEPVAPQPIQIPGKWPFSDGSNADRKQRTRKKAKKPARSKPEEF